jgi:hypothetical protein
MNNLKIIETESPTSISQASLASLVATIRLEFEKGKARAFQAMEQEKKLTYWNVGKHIKEHLLAHSDRAEYGQNLLTQLANELNIGKTTLYRSLKFYESYPQIVHAREQLTWTHYKSLLAIPDKKTRKDYEQKALKENLSSRELKKIIKANKELTTPKAPPITQLSVTRNKPFIYRLKEVQHKIVVDLGFQFFIESPFQGLSKDAIIQVNKKSNKYTHTILAEAKAAPHYIYKAYFIEAIDGDTVWVNIDLGFNTWTKQKLRLFRINTQSIETSAGIEAQEFIASQLKDCQFIAVKTYWRDKFTRYLADIFYDKNEPDFLALTQHGKLINQELLDLELAVTY